MVSDLILSMFAFYFFFQHRNVCKKWSLFFLFMGLSAFIGGIYHGYPGIGEQFRFISWTLLSISLINAQLAAYSNVKNNTLKLVLVTKSILLLILALQNVNFTLMIIDTAFSMLGVIVLGNILFLKSLSNYITYGILISLTSVFFIVFKISLNPKYLNYYDIGHYISILSISFMSWGIKKDYYRSYQKLSWQQK
jgi:uncharacterized protein DUF6962